MNELNVNSQAPDDTRNPAVYRHPPRPQRHNSPRGQRPSAVQAQLFREEAINDRPRDRQYAKTAPSAARAQPKMVLTGGAAAILALIAGFLTFGQSRDTADAMPQIIADTSVGLSEQSNRSDVGPRDIFSMLEVQLSQPVTERPPIITMTVSAKTKRAEQPNALTTADVSAPFVCGTCQAIGNAPQVDVPTLYQMTDVDRQGASKLAAYSTDARPSIITPIFIQSAAPDERPFVPRDAEKDLQAVHAVYHEQICLALGNC